MFKYRRPDEQDYALLKPASHPSRNRYGRSIETVPADSPLRGQSLNINGDSRVGDHPDRYKQHGFYFTADNCIACHACESACSEKNDLPPHQAFRAVGYVEGGHYPEYRRLNISMACNHCDNPVCLKGCPTRAYTKFAEYGAVLQDPDICFGCGYCTWVCPYNAPQLDHSRGHVSKCNMCVDRLEAGLKPACVSACLAGALNFGVIETTPENRQSLDTRIPGFPTTDITHPNIRFQQTQALPETMTRTDSMPIRYQRDDKGDYRPGIEPVTRPARWSWKKLSTRENPLVIFTLVSQAVVGMFLLLFLGPQLGIHSLSPDANPLAWPLTLFGLIGVQTLALVLSTMHLGKPHRFYRAFNNLRYSPVSREVAGIAVFYNFLGAYTLLTGMPSLFQWLPASLYQGLAGLCGWGASFSGLAAIYFMHRIYRIPARPFWNHWQVLSSFYGSMLTLGAAGVLLIGGGVGLYHATGWQALIPPLGGLLIAGLLVEMLGLYCHQRDLRAAGGEGAASHFEQLTRFGKTYHARNLGLLVVMALMAGAMAMGSDSVVVYGLLTVMTVLLLLVELVGRALFYAVVIPTTMPGAFFWRNAGFQEHARETGLAEMPQVGVLPDVH